MAPLLKSLLGNGSRDREHAEEMRAILHDMQQERARYQTLLENTQAAAERLGQLGEPIAQAESGVSAVSEGLAKLQQRFEAMLKLSTQIMNLDERAEGLAQSQQRTEAQIATTLAEAERIRSMFEDIGRKIDLALELKDKLGAFLEVEKPFQQLHGEADALRGQVEGTGDQLARLREQHDRLLDAHKLGMSKMEALDRRREEFSRDLQDKERRVASVEASLRGIDGVQTTVDHVKREMGTLKALGEFVAQKSAALEAQRDAVETALTRADQLERAMRQIDAGVSQQQQNEKLLGALQDDVAALRSLHESVLERSGEITQLQRDADERAQAARHDLALMRDETKQTLERFDFENRGLESVSQRVADLRAALSDFENRFKSLSETGQIVAELKPQAQALSAHFQTLSDQVGQVDQDLAKLQALRRDLDLMSRTSRDTGAQVAQIEAARPALEAALRDLEQLSRVDATVKDALEHTVLAHGEIVRVRESQSDTRSWLANVEQSVGALGEQVGHLQKLAPTIDVAHKQAERVHESMSAIAARGAFVEDMHRRMAELGALTGTLDERGQQLQTRMDAAEHRFVGLASHAEEAESTAKTIAAVSSGVIEARREADQIAKTVAAIEARCESVEELAEKTRVLKQELDQRRHTLAETAKDLKRASELRQEAAASAQQLGELSKRLGASLTSADQRTESIAALSTQLEDRAAELQSVEKRLDLFEQRMAKWDLVEPNVARALEQISARQGTLEALEADLGRMFVMAEKTSTEVREITSARREIEESREVLDDVMGRLREVRETASALDERKRQLSKAEERLARADALLVDVRSGIESLQGQKVIVDQAVAKTSSLRSMLKQAESVIEGLKDERKMTADVRAAVTLVRKSHDEDDSEDSAKAA